MEKETDSMKHEENLPSRQESEERYRRIVETAWEGILEIDVALLMTYANKRMADILGYAEGEMIGRRLYDFIDSSSHHVAMTQIEQRKKGKKDRYEVLMLRKNGEKIWAAISASPIFDKKGVFIGSFAMISDISARKRAEEQLRASEVELRVIFNNAHDAIFIHELSGEIIDVNDKALELYGGDKERALSLSIRDDFSGPDNPIDQLPLLWEKVVTGENQFFEWQARRIDDGSLFDVEVSLRRILLHQRYAILATIRDITARKEAEREIERLYGKLTARAAELEAVNMELEAFNFTVSHDLRRPLTAINGYCQLIQMRFDNNLEEQCRGYIRNMYESTLQMNQLIDTLLEFSRANRVEMHTEAVDLSKIAEEVIIGLQGAQPERQILFQNTSKVVVPGDPKLLRVVLDNLIGNAWKYSHRQEGARIEFGVAGTKEKPVYFVRDNGPGFAMALADKLFIPFQRLHGNEVEGHGIGLATVERIVRRHGGEIWAESHPGQGATFFFTLQ